VQDQINVLQAQLEVPALSRAQRDSIESQISYYESQLNQLRVATRLTRTGGVQLLTQATNPSVPFAPQPLRNAAIAAVLGLLLGVALAFAREHLDDTIRSKDDLETASRGLTVVGLIPAVAGWRDRSQPLVVAMNDPASPAAEAYRTLRTSVQFLRVDRPLQVVQITSAEPEEGKTTTAANLAIALARAGERVLLIECDLRRSRLHEFFGLRATPGFTSLLLGDTPVAEAVHQVEGEPRVYVLPSGPTPPNPSELLSSARAREVLTSFRANVDIVIVDSPPVLPVTDAMVLAGVVDATLVVAAAGKTSKRALARAIELLQQVNAPLIGTVLNSVRPRAAGSYGYEYGTGYGYAMKNEAPRIRRRGRRRLGDLRGETLLPRKT
jgi:polysaccharide biosynthesis transport protein